MVGVGVAGAVVETDAVVATVDAVADQPDAVTLVAVHTVDAVCGGSAMRVHIDDAMVHLDIGDGICDLHTDGGIVRVAVHRYALQPEIW